MPSQIQILNIHSTGREKSLTALFSRKQLANLKITEAYYVSVNLSVQQFIQAGQLLCNPVSQQNLNAKNIIKILSAYGKFRWVIEVRYLPGVTDNVGHTAGEIIRENLKNVKKSLSIGSALLYFLDTKEKNIIDAVAAENSNPLIHGITILSFKDYVKKLRSNKITDFNVKLSKKKYITKKINLNVSREELHQIGKQGILENNKIRRGPLGLDVASLQAIQAYFNKQKRQSTDVEIETLAQTWSEHCKHKIFSSSIDNIHKGIFSTYIRDATRKIIKKRKDNFCVSLFSDNAGAVSFDNDWLVCHKVETHNTPSALDPFGGAITGIVGVNRDCLGFGKGAKPIANTYAFYFAYPHKNYNLYRQQNKKSPMLSARLIAKGVIHGVRVGGNCSGIPTPQGTVYFHDGYAGKPLVFCGTVGLIPRKIKGQFSHLKGAQPGDHVIMVGGRVGKDGIHGATFSSEKLDPNSPVTAVQIGDPITQKKFSDVIIRELREKNLYSSITDNGAGGLSSSVGEMAKESGGFTIDLEKIPLKYEGLYLWEIWISESQERMTLAVHPKNVQKVISIFTQRGVEATSIGRFTKKKKAIVRYNNVDVMNMDMEFLHEGYPKLHLKTSKPSFTKIKKSQIKKHSFKKELLTLLGSPNICSKEFISTQYDHEVQATSIIKPLQGEGRVFSDATAIKPLFSSNQSLALSQAAFPRYANLDAYKMAACSVDTAVRNLVVLGANIKKIALLDNFCWCSPEEEERLYQLKKAAEACHDYALAYRTPFISGKDSMYNDFSGFDAKNNKIKISIPPTLLISSLGIVKSINDLTSICPSIKDLIYVIGETKEELGGSEYGNMFGYENINVPSVNPKKALKLYNVFSRANKKDLISSAISVHMGGLGVAFSKMAIASQTGMQLDLSKINLFGSSNTLFAESQSRIIVSIKPSNKKVFEKLFTQHIITRVGECTSKKKFLCRLSNKDSIQVTVSDLTRAYKGNIKKL